MGVESFTHVSYQGSEYTIAWFLFKEIVLEFLVDRSDWDTIQPYSWHYTSNGYLATTLKDDATGKKREVYLHTFLMKPTADQVVQHISGNGLDNRRSNLRLVPKEAATVALQRVKKKRNVELPPMCGIKPEDIPKHVWYVQANGYHRDRFAIEFKTEGILWKSSSSKDLSLQEKLESAKEKLSELYAIYPHLDPKREEEEVGQLETQRKEITAAAATALAATQPLESG